MGAVVHAPGTLTPGVAALVYASYLVVFGGLAGWRLLRTDA
jgi:hypothetical protein